MASGDKGKTGLSSLAAAAGYLIALFSWVFIMFFATGTNGVGMWIEETETKLAAYVQDTFVFADLIMVLVGASMLKGIRKLDLAQVTELIPFIATVAAGALTGNIALGVAIHLTYSSCIRSERGGYSLRVTDQMSTCSLRPRRVTVVT